VLRQGGDPLSANPLDPLKRPLNYPRLMLFLFSLLHITDRNLPIFGVALCAVYLAAVTRLIFEGSSTLEVLTLLVASLSLVPLFAIHQGNTDLLIFALVFLACTIRKDNIRPVILFAAAMLKIYPLAALVADAVQRPAKKRLFSILLTVLAIVGMAWQWRDLLAVSHATPQSPILSFGVLSIKKGLALVLLRNGVSSSASMNAGWLAVSACWLAGIVTAVAALRGALRLDPRLLRSRQGFLFCAFGAIYVFSFAVGSNFDYRLIYLIPTLPFVIRSIRAQSHIALSVAYIFLVLVMLNWLNDGFGFGLLVQHVATFVLFLMILSVLAGQAKNFLWKSDPEVSAMLGTVAQAQVAS
jgi:hypothetical protein